MEKVHSEKKIRMMEIEAAKRKQELQETKRKCDRLVEELKTKEEELNQLKEEFKIEKERMNQLIDDLTTVIIVSSIIIVL